MHTSDIIHNKVMNTYRKKQEKYRNDLHNVNEEIYSLFPEIREIDNNISLLTLKHANRIITENISPEEAVEAVNSEKEMLLSKRKAILSTSNRHFVYPKYDCQVCNDTGSTNGQRCSCYMELAKQIISEETNGSKNISFDMENDVFENFSLDWYSKDIIDSKVNVSPYDIMKIAYNKAIAFCNNFTSSNLYFYGNSGTGKTFLASCIANDLIKKGYKVIYQSSYKLFQFMEDYKFCRIDRDSNTKFYDSIYNCDLLIIDDLGTEFSTAYTCSVLFDILNTRLVNGKSTIISTNLAFPNLESKYTERVYSRIVGNFDVIRFMGDDIRILKKQSR